jgi:pilus assembly protein FimV
MEQELLLVREAGESTRQETIELRDRIRELESQLGEIQQLLKLRNAELARMQGVTAPTVLPQPGEAQGAGEAPVLAAAPEGGRPVGVEPPMETRAETPVEVPAPVTSEAEQTVDQAPERALAAPGAPEIPEGETPAALEGPVETLELPIPVAESESPLEVPGSPAPVEGAAPGGEVVAEGEAPSPGPTESPLEVAAAKPEAVAPASEVARPEATKVKPGAGSPETSEETGAGLPLPWDDLLVPLAGAAGVTALGIGALAWVRARRRRASEESYVAPEGLELAQQRASSPSKPKGGRPAAPVDSPSGLGDTGGLGPAAVAPPSVFSALGRSQAESDEADVLSEADIYIAYGRYREAEELLREEIERTPGRTELKYKLAESYHGARNYPALDALMKEMQAAGEDRLDPERWQRLVDMAKAIEGLERADAGVRPAALRAAPAATGLVDRGGPRSGEAFSLDISDARGPAGSFGLSEDLDYPLGSAGDPSQRDVPVLRSSRPAPAPRQDLDPLSLDLDVLSHSLDLDAQPHGAGLEVPLKQEPFEQEQDDGIGAVSDLELTIDDLRAASDVDLESFVDSTRTVSNLVDEPLSGQEPTTDTGGRASRPAKLRAVTSDGAGADNAKGLSGSLYGLDEEGSSDLLSSQWQMDSGLWDETATKLDLARAYVEMGDQDSAKGILEEVANEGNEEQRSEAAQMLRALG